MFSFIKSKIQKFRDDADGTIMVESVLVLPVLFWAATATYTFFDVYKVENTTYRANFTISDMLSRETQEIDSDYTAGLYKVFRFMTGATTDNSWIRISVLNCTSSCGSEDDRVLEFLWSHGENGAVNLAEENLVSMKSMIPLFSKGDQLIFVETFTDYTPPFAESLTHFAGRDIRTNVATRPRFAPQLVWKGSGATGSDVTDIPA